MGPPGKSIIISLFGTTFAIMQVTSSSKKQTLANDRLLFFFFFFSFSFFASVHKQPFEYDISSKRNKWVLVSISVRHSNIFADNRKLYVLPLENFLKFVNFTRKKFMKSLIFQKLNFFIIKLICVYNNKKILQRNLHIL